MKIPFEPVDNRADRDPFEPSARPETIRWWRLAPPPPFLLVVVRVTEVSADGNRICCMFVGPHSGHEVDGPVWVDLTDQKNVWPGPPSTIDLDRLEIGQRDHVVMCFSEEWLEANAVRVVGEFAETTPIKWPWGEPDALVDALAAAADLAKRLRENQVKLAAVEDLVAKMREGQARLAAVEDLVANMRENQQPEKLASFQKIQQLY